MNTALETLFRFLTEEQVNILTSATRIGFPRAEFHPKLTTLSSKTLYLQQSFKPEVDKLLLHGLTLSDDIGAELDLALFIPTRQRIESLAWITKLYQRLKVGGRLVVSAENTLGAKSYRKSLGLLGTEVNSWSKSKCVVSWLEKSSESSVPILEEWAAALAEQKIDGTNFISRPGIYGWNQVDAGSKLLLSEITYPLNGDGANLGANYGLIAHELISRNPELRSITLYEAEKMALDLARRNLADLNTRIKINYEWADIFTLSEKRRYDWIVTNPPFHGSRGEDLSIGFQFIRKASQLVKAEGTVYMVFNDHLPYKPVLEQYFETIRELKNIKSFRVVKALKPKS